MKEFLLKKRFGFVLAGVVCLGLLGGGCQNLPCSYSAASWRSDKEKAASHKRQMGTCSPCEEDFGSENLLMNEVNYDEIATHAPKAAKLGPPRRPAQNWLESMESDTNITDPGQMEHTPTQSYTVQSGDSLWSIAKRHQVSVAALAQQNNMRPDSVLRVGQKLFISTTPKTTIVSDDARGVGSVYTIQKGDTLTQIANRFNVKVADLRSANKLGNDQIFSGKQLLIPGVAQAVVDSKQMPTIVSQPKKAEIPAHFASGEPYLVKSGDTLSVIAKRFGVSVADLMAWNGISNARQLRAGQKLVISKNNANAQTSQSATLATAAAQTVQNPSVSAQGAPSAESSAPTSDEENAMLDDLFSSEFVFDDSDGFLFESANQTDVVPIEGA